MPEVPWSSEDTPPDDEGFLSNVDSNEYEDLPQARPGAGSQAEEETNEATRPSNTNPMGKQIGIAIAVIIGLVVGFLSTNGKFNLGDASDGLAAAPVESRPTSPGSLMDSTPSEKSACRSWSRRLPSPKP